jgi:hypothetical protein
VLVNWVADPVDAGVTADGLVEGVDQDHLEPLVNGILRDAFALVMQQVG